MTQRAQKLGNARRAGFNLTGPLAGFGHSVLSMLGVKVKEEQKEQVENIRKMQAQAAQPHKIPIEIQLWLGARLPFVSFVSILGFFTYVYHLAPIVPWLLAFFSTAFAIIVCWPPRLMGSKHRDLWDWSMMWSWGAAVGFAVVFGLINYGIIESWINTTFLREYRDVSPNANAKSVMDAGILTFNKDSILNIEMSAGYKHWFYNYCAAPVVNHKDPRSAPVTFWAVGVGCCGARGEFTCDSAADKSANSGVPLNPHNLGPEVTAHYDSAVRMAAATNNLEVSEDHVFIMWHKDPKAVGKWAWWFCTMIFMGLTLVALCSCCACQSGLSHINIMQQN